MNPDPEKVEPVQSMPTSTSAKELQKFLDVVTYLSPLIPGLSMLTDSICELLKKDAEWIWNATYEAAFQRAKDVIVKDAILMLWFITASDSKGSCIQGWPRFHTSPDWQAGGIC